MTQYLADNPRRLWVKMHHGDLFAKTRVVIDGQVAQTMGNIHLLNYGN